ncbi:carbon-phosphorus lyase complex subunit PhnI [Frondihabitans sucicola]|uniref:Carbon-phosphorus lyase complex subunit PhnI n=1 Tax=Frondihabitans sucicola TaxID=1268041 RepID=A0ABM8GSM2_9MICO|nr:carbon-phosphorus lyase complex subunit PhnI [Frondihabitans sucicola]BDZ51424.1 carbon-phosphorus lyase complex subunit PhnI [Frondihabitans sucicola]
MYVAVKGGERAIANAHALLAKEGRGDAELPELSTEQVAGQFGVLVSRVMTEGSLYDPELAARALSQAQGDALEAVTLLRSYRTTLPRFGYSEALDTTGLPPQRRISATFKDLPGGQQLGATFDYTHRLFAEAPTEGPELADHTDGDRVSMPRVSDLLGANALIEPDAHPDQDATEPGDLTREPTVFPMTRAERLQALARGDEGFLLGLAYSSQRGFGSTHPFAGEIRVGEVEVEFDAPELGFPVPLGRIEITECQMVNQFTGSADSPAMFTRGYGLAFGRSERKAMSMSIVDRALRADEFDERIESPVQDEEFVISHSDNVQATGFVEHLKLPHYVDFQAELVLVRRLNREFHERQDHAEPVPSDLVPTVEEVLA